MRALQTCKSQNLLIKRHVEEDTAMRETERVIKEDHAQIRRVTFEHDRWRSLVVGLEEAVRSRRSTGFAFYAEKQVAALRDHVDGEERVVLSLAAGTLSEEEDQRVAAEMRRFDHLWQLSLVDRVLQRLEEIELRYNRKADAPAH
jgi:hemerythrin-like domain-containing protein